VVSLAQQNCRFLRFTSCIKYLTSFKACTLDVLMHLPRSVFSVRQLELFVWLLKINGVQDVTSVKSMKDLDSHLQKLYGIQTFKYKGALGHTYHVNSLADIISQVIDTFFLHAPIELLRNRRWRTLMSVKNFHSIQKIAPRKTFLKLEKLGTKITDSGWKQ
jgi:hypothetical protein